jgi:cytochrome c oxidase subunit 2
MTSVVTIGQQFLRDMWFSRSNSTQAAETDFLFFFVLWVNILSFLFLMGTTTYFVIKYRSRPGVPTQRSVSHNTPLELAWSIIPLIVMVPIFFWGFAGFLKKQAAPAGSEEIRVNAEKWKWTPVYSNGGQPKEYQKFIHEDNDVPVIFVPAGRPVKLIMTSKDVIHSLFIPDFRTKIDVTPNRYTSMWFQAIDPTPYDPDTKTYKDHYVFCAEYCGDNHSQMAALLRVVPADQYEALKADLLLPPEGAKPEELGEFWWSKRFGCKQCHTIDGKASTGPTWFNLWGSTVEFDDGTTLDLKDAETFFNYVRESVYEPQAKTVKGFPKTTMNSFQGLLDEKQLSQIIAFMRSPKVSPATAPAGGGDQPKPPEAGAPKGGSGGVGGAGGEAKGETPAKPGGK